MGSPVSVVRHLTQGTEITWFLAVICSCHRNRPFKTVLTGCSLVSNDGYLISKKIVQILDMQYLAYVANFRQKSCVAVSVT